MATQEEIKALEATIEKVSPDEPNDAYQAFLRYASYIGKQRTLERVASDLGFGLTTVQVWSSRYQWMKRVDQVDAQRWIIEHRKREELLEQDNKHFIEENREIKQKSITIAKKMLNTATNLLSSADLAGKVIETDKVTLLDGSVVPLKTTIEMKSKVSDIPRLVEVAVKVARLSADLPTEIVRPQILSSDDLEKLSAEELLQLAQDNRAELNRLGITQNISDANN